MVGIYDDGVRWLEIADATYRDLPMLGLPGRAGLARTRHGEGADRRGSGLVFAFAARGGRSVTARRPEEPDRYDRETAVVCRTDRAPWLYG